MKLLKKSIAQRAMVAGIVKPEDVDAANITDEKYKENFPDMLAEKLSDEDFNLLLEIRRIELLATIKNIGMFFMILTIVSIVVWLFALMVTFN